MCYEVDKGILESCVCGWYNLDLGCERGEIFCDAGVQHLLGFWRIAKRFKMYNTPPCHTRKTAENKAFLGSIITIIGYVFRFWLSILTSRSCLFVSFCGTEIL